MTSSMKTNMKKWCKKKNSAIVAKTAYSMSLLIVVACVTAFRCGPSCMAFVAAHDCDDRGSTHTSKNVTSNKLTKKWQYLRISSSSAYSVSSQQYEDPLHIEQERRDLQQVTMRGDNGKPKSAFPLGLCEGDCDKDYDCEGDLICHKRNGGDPVPGCRGGEELSSDKDFCVLASASGPAPAPEDLKQVTMRGDNGTPKSAFPLGLCEGDCDKDSDCEGGLICHQRNGGDPVPGCSGGEELSSDKDFCVHASASAPAPAPTRSTSTGGSSSKLKLYWQSGYTWQEETRERKWCLRCQNSCSAGEKVILVKCDDDRPNSWTFLYPGSNNNEVLVQVNSNNMCLERRSSGSKIHLQKCNSDIDEQRWVLANRGTGEAGVERFEITPKGKSDLCITQPHHPKYGEIIYVAPCSVARRDKSSFWNKY